MEDNLNPKFPPLPPLAKDMSLRDYFAAQAMGAVALSPKTSAEDACRVWYAMADAMLKEREKS